MLLRSGRWISAVWYRVKLGRQWNHNASSLSWKAVPLTLFSLPLYFIFYGMLLFYKIKNIFPLSVLTQPTTKISMKLTIPSHFYASDSDQTVFWGEWNSQTKDVAELGNFRSNVWIELEAVWEVTTEESGISDVLVGPTRLLITMSLSYSSNSVKKVKAHISKNHLDAWCSRLNKYLNFFFQTYTKTII